MNNLTFIKPTNLAEAAKILKQPGYMAIAGGTDLIVKIRNGLFPNLTGIVDISSLPLKEIIISSDKVTIGSGCTMSQIINHPEIKRLFPTLVKAASTVGAMQIRNAATIGGNIGNASPAGDTIPALFSLEATICIAGETDRRKMPINEFFKAPGKTALAAGELIEAFEIPLRETSGSFLKLGERRAHAISKINMAVTTWKDDKQRYRIAMGSVGPTVMRCEKAEELLEAATQPISDEIIQKAAALAEETARPISDVRSSQKYRKKMAGVLLNRALKSLKP